jgi:hypothetical protein
LTALGIDNYGRMTYRYGYEEIDYVDGTQDWVWNAPNHVFFLRLRKLFDEELCDLYTTLESTGCWNATSLINQFNDWQMQFPEELWRTDIQRKYIRTYTESFIGGKAYPEFLTERANGRKKTQRSQFERNQEKYMSSKFGGTVASADDVILRCSVPNTALVIQPNFDITLTAYGHVYASVKYNTDVRPRKYRLKPNETYTFEYNAELADIIELYSASCLKDIGDLSACYLTNGTFANATKIRELKLGNDTEGYNNTNVMTLGLGSNELLNKLDIQNMSGLTHSLDLSGLKNLEELYAFGSGTSGVIFADGGNIRIAEIPDVGTLQMKNLNYLTDEGFEATSYYSLSRLVAEHSKLDLIDLINNSPNLRQVRLTGINWELEDIDLLERMYELAGVTNTGANVDQSVLTGTVSVPTIGQYELYKYQETWSDLTIVPRDGIIPQYKVTFRNYDGTELDVQYIDQYGSAVDPITREEDAIAIPTKESSIQYSYSYSGWDKEFTNIVMDIEVYATYEESLREYTIKYVSMGVPVKTATGLYGENIVYDGDMPTYTAAEPTAFYLFNRWDKSGFLTGDFDENGVKTVTAIFDKFDKGVTYFSDKRLMNLSPVEIYATIRLSELGKFNIGSNEGQTDEDYDGFIINKDGYTITVGNDIDYDDIESELLISKETYFNGKNTHIDTGIKLFDEDKDFVIAIDYEFLTGCTSGATLVQCYQPNTSQGFNLSYNGNNAQVTWGTSSSNVVGINKREMIVLRHKKGDNNLIVYKSNFDGGSISTIEISKKQTTITDATLIFGASSFEEGFYENHAIGNISWAKIWHKDLGDDVCKSLAMWTHESIHFEACGFRRFFLSDDFNEPTNQRCSFSMLASHLLGRTAIWNASGNNSGGWANSDLNYLLNTRLYNAMPTQIRSLLKRMAVPSSMGSLSKEISHSGCYITVPALAEIVSDYADDEVYKDEIRAVSGIYKSVTYMTQPATRKRAFTDGSYYRYWTRSPNIAYSNYVWSIDESGNPQAITNPSTTPYGVLIEISF